MAEIANMAKYKKRVIDSLVEKYLKTFGAICIEGPKWCGKTWTSSYYSKSEFLIGNPDNNFQNRSLAELSPSLVLEGDTPRLLDEWQEVPPIWDAVRYIVDQRNEKGQFILTGSSTTKQWSASSGWDLYGKALQDLHLQAAHTGHWSGTLDYWDIWCH
jgi:predicted AAA+ superfamily ATPase